MTIDNIKVIKDNFDTSWKEYGKEIFNITDELKKQGLTVEIYSQIKELYPTISITKYLGEYNSAYVVFYEDMGIQIGENDIIEVAGELVYTKNELFRIRVIYEGKSYDQQEAYDNGILAIEDLIEVFQKYNGYLPNEIIVDNDSINKQMIRNIIKQYYNEIISVENPDFEWNLSKLYYDGDYHKVYEEAIFVVINFNVGDFMLVEEEIAGFIFPFDSWTRYIIYKGDQIYTLEEAYNNNIINKNTIESIYNDMFR